MDQNQQNPMGSSPMSSQAPVSNPSPTPSSMPSSAPMSTHEGKKVGPIVASLVIVLVLIIAALYLFASRVNKEPVPTDNDTVPAVNTTNASAAVQSQPSVPTVSNNSDDPASLQTDLNASLKNVDQQNF